MTEPPPTSVWTDEADMLVHVGLHKCGSTWLQRYMFDSSEIGFVSPWGKLASLAVTEFVTVDPLNFDTERVRARFLAAAKPIGEGQTIVLSHEALSSRPHHGSYYAPYVADRIQSVFPSSRILMIFREQKSLIHSLYGEHLRNGGMATLPEFIGTGSEPPGFTGLCALSFFEFDNLYDMYRDRFGVDRVLALPLEMLSEQPDDFVRRICAFVDRPVHPLPTDRKVNSAWGAITYQALRWSNVIVRGNRLKPRKGPVFTFRRRVLNLMDRSLPKAMQQKLLTRQKDMISARIGDRYMASNRRMAEMLRLDLAGYGYDC